MEQNYAIKNEDYTGNKLKCVEKTTTTKGTIVRPWNK
jgi:hypothetical protein